MLRQGISLCRSCRGQLRRYSAVPQPNAPSASVSASSAAQPLSTPATSAPAPTKRPRAPKAVQSSVQPGTVMRGLNILKSGTDPVALPEDGYPAFLWTLLDDKAAVEPRKQARRTNRAAIKRKNFFSGKL